jgi:hypothetical protein
MLPHLLVQELRANKGFNSAGQAWLLLNIRRMDTCDTYPGYASRLTATGLLSDPWLDGRPRFQRRPLMLSSRDLASLYEAAEGVLAVLHELAVICVAEPQLVQHWFGLTRAQQIMWAASAPAWHGIARADVFMTQDGPVVCEVNCDTPSGEAEAVELGALAAAEQSECFDPCLNLGDRLCSLVESMAPSRTEKLVVGFVYPTEFSEDLSMVALYRRWFQRRGWRVVLGSPFNLCPTSDGGVALFGSRCDVLVRHYKTDWWGERLPVWRDEPAYPDPEPLVGPLGLVLGAVLRGRVGVVNPFGAVLAQNKRTFAFLWEEINRFPVWAQPIIRRFVPRSLRMELLEPETLLGERMGWVLKSDFGCEGAEVVVGAEVDDGLWAVAVHQAVPQRWIAQERFCPCRDDDGAGLFCRIQAGATDRRAVTAPVLVADGLDENCWASDAVAGMRRPETPLSVRCP